jgi:hypothetical protein
MIQSRKIRRRTKSVTYKGEDKNTCNALAGNPERTIPFLNT